MDIIDAIMETTKNYQHFLPAEVLLYIFAFLDARTLVINCRGVCKFWKDTVRSSDMWKLQIRRLTVSNKALDSILPTAHNVYAWYICYALCKNIFDTNLILGSVPERRPRADAVSNFCGMIYYSAIGTYLLRFSPRPQELLDEGANFCLLAPFGECNVKHTIDLYARGFTNKIHEFHPPIVINMWVTKQENCHMISGIRNQEEKEADDENGKFYNEIVTEGTDWHNVRHTFTTYRSDVRYVTLEYGVDMLMFPTLITYREITFRDPGSKVAAAKIVINLPDLSEPTSSTLFDSDETN